VKYLEHYDWSFNPQVAKTLILDLATARFVREHGGILLLARQALFEKEPLTREFKYDIY